jgi:cation transport regulator ChaC
MKGDRWYFAYGSNLLVEQKIDRTGPIRQAIRCRLTGFRFVFNKRGDDGQIFANIVPDEAAEVWGVAYLCNPQAIEKMDRREGVARGDYEHKQVTVTTDGGKSLNALTYVAGADFICEPGSPQAGYLSKIINGARQHQLPEDYIARIERLAIGDQGVGPVSIPRTRRAASSKRRKRS